MIIWLNGAFGAGNTTTANELVTRVPGPRLFDPEQVGYMLRHVLADEVVCDFQDWAPWHARVIDTTDRAAHDVAAETAADTTTQRVRR